jgi:hypothetical protein
LLCLAQQGLSRHAGQKQLGFLTPAFSIHGKTLLMRFEFLETSPVWLHGGGTLVGAGGSAIGLSVTGKSREPGGDKQAYHGLRADSRRR